MPSSPLAIFFDDPAQRALDVVNVIVRHIVLVHRHVVQSALSTQGEEQDVRLLLPRRWRLRRLEEGIGGSVNKHGRSAPNESFSYPAEDAAAQIEILRYQNIGRSFLASFFSRSRNILIYEQYTVNSTAVVRHAQP